ncbi:MAG: hypothetical protein ACT4PW_06060 [Acidimicrobiia bacterium]
MSWSRVGRRSALLGALLAAATVSSAGPAGADRPCAKKEPKVIGSASVDSNGDRTIDFVAILLALDPDGACLPNAVGQSTDGNGTVDKGERVLVCPPPVSKVPVVVQTAPLEGNNGVRVDVYCRGLFAPNPNPPPDDVPATPTFSFVVHDANGDGDTKDPGEVRNVPPKPKAPRTR